MCCSTSAEFGAVFCATTDWAKQQVTAISANRPETRVLMEQSSPPRYHAERLRGGFGFCLWFPDEGRVPHISLVFREMWDTTVPSLWLSIPTIHLAVNMGGITHLEKNE